MIQIGLQRRASMPDVPTLVELAKNEDDRRILMAISSGDILGRAFVVPPDTDRDRLADLRQAFDAMAKDPEVLEAATQAEAQSQFSERRGHPGARPSVQGAFARRHSVAETNYSRSPKGR